MGAFMARHLRAVLYAALACAGIATAAMIAIADTADPSGPIEGRWYGKAGFPTDRVDLGFEFKHDGEGAITAALYGPIFNYYGLMVPGGLTRESDGSYVNKEWGFKLALTNGEMTGVLFAKTPVTLHRVDTLPSEPPMPALSNGPGPRWQTKLAAPIYARAAVRDGAAYVGTLGGEFHAINISDGSFRWTYSAGRGIYGEALTTDDRAHLKLLQRENRELKKAKDILCLVSAFPRRRNSTTRNDGLIHRPSWWHGRSRVDLQDPAVCSLGVL